jgi:CRISPR system Cascade subunit CasD
MKSVLLIPIVGPMQSWGTRSRFQERDTEREPSKSGVIGLLCAALGRDRSEPINDLADLKMGVRVDREGTMRVDFQTAQGVAVASGGSPQNQISNRHYLSDAAFMVCFEGDTDLLSDLQNALRSPVWPIFLGRKSYVPSLPPYVPDGLKLRSNLRDALLAYPLLSDPDGSAIRLVLESSEMTYESRVDNPVSFALGKRKFGERYVKTEFVPTETFPAKEDDDVPVATRS